MVLSTIPPVELDNYCRQTIRSLELWLRRILHETLSENFGVDYVNQIDANGTYLINSRIRNKILSRISASGSSYPRPIDATDFNDVISILCRENLYRDLFSHYFQSRFPIGLEQLRLQLNTLVPLRNSLAHSNTISVREAEKIICYAHDVIDSISERYSIMGRGHEFNCPMIIGFADSFGSVFRGTQIRRNNLGEGSITRRELILRPGDLIRVDFEVDASFDVSEYTCTISIGLGGKKKADGVSASYQIADDDVGLLFPIVAEVVSRLNWHRMGRVDDKVLVAYRVLPPIG